ncbi:MAG: M23 family metallopeptidase [Rickettsiales bacterium]|nr:M23 family metallopeptidase [Rickettsiales bacterium]
MKRLPLLIFALAALPVFADCDVRGVDPDAPVLCGNAVQGGFLYGESDWQVMNEAKMFCSSIQCAWWGEDGIFVIGIPMDADESLKLRFCKDKKCKTFDYKIKRRKYIEQRVKVDEKFIEYPPEIQKRIDSENEKIAAARGMFDASFAEFMDWKYPFRKKYPVSGAYGSRRVFNGVQKSPHKGWDIAAPKGTPVRSIERGRVVLAIDSYMSGKTVMVSHGYGIFSLYAHLDKTSAKPGAVVTADSVLGTVGATGRASGPHLHLGLYFGQTPLDPELLFE